jgi:hypothetical protein
VHRVEITITDGKWIQTHAFDISVTSDTVEIESVDSESEPSSAVPVIQDGNGSETSMTEATQEQEKVGDSMTAFPAVQSEEYGLVPVDQEAEKPAGGVVLGEAVTLPRTASKVGFFGASLAVAALSAAIFLWADARWNILGSVRSSVRYARGEQIGLDIDNGMRVKKRKIRI